MTETEPVFSFDRGWFASKVTLDGANGQRVDRAVDQFFNDPNHPGLNLHPLRSDRSGRLYTFRASRDLRVLVAKEANLYLLLEAGHHDAIYERATRTRLVINPRRQYIGVVTSQSADELDPGAAVTRERQADAATAAATYDEQRPALLDHWTDAELREAGLADGDIAKVRAWYDEDQVWNLKLSDEAFDLVVDLLETTPEQRRNLQLAGTEEPESRLRQAVTAFGATAGLSPLLSPEEAARLAAAPIEEWMVFLHPDQRDAVRRRYDGPARVRGSAGTGKTVVALHRAAALAERYREAWQRDGLPILFTTYIKSLPPVFEALYRRLPGTVEGEVHFVHVDKLAFGVCAEAGARPTINPKDTAAAFASAWSDTVVPGSPLESSAFSKGYLKEEVTSVIKGRGLTSLDEYLAIERTGRRTPMSATQREQMWKLWEAWDREMTQRGTTDFPDIVRRARDHARQSLYPSYRAAIIDEAQDLTLVGLQLVRALVNGAAGADVPDGLFICGDGGQRIYPGGFTLRQAGVEVRGRTTVLRHNYRNTNEIIEAAMAVAGGADIDDLGDKFKRDEALSQAGKDGPVPTLVVAPSFADELAFVAETIANLAESDAVSYGDMAVTVTTNKQADEVTAALRERGIPTLDLDKYKGTPTDQVKVGTHFRSKGLEFKVVFLPGLGSDHFPAGHAGTNPTAPETNELRQRSLSQLYVAMTRARDALFVLCTGTPADELADAVGSFHLVEL